MVLAKIELGRDVHCCGRFQKPSTTPSVLNGVFGSVNRGGLGMFQKGAFLEGPGEGGFHESGRWCKMQRTAGTSP
jgi:hypothetical protein